MIVITDRTFDLTILICCHVLRRCASLDGLVRVELDVVHGWDGHLRHLRHIISGAAHF